jgi:release factor glutamine methyltransferase
MSTLFEVYKEACKKLENPTKDEINIRILLCAINDLKSMSEFYLKKNEDIKDLQRFNKELSRFLAGEPIQYIVGETEFFGSNFKVDRRVLIPRQETEEVALYTLRKIMSVFPNKEISLADVCCGSGCIGISLAKHLPINTLYLSDISQDACNVAVENIALNNISGYVLHGDALKPFIDHNIKLDVIVANPPYILNRDEVDKSVLDYEPQNALFTDDNLTIYRSILENIDKVMNDKILIVFEIGYDLREKLICLMQELEMDCTFTFRKDINNKDRIFSLLLERKIES